MKYQTNLTLHRNIRSPEEILEKSANIEDVISKVLRLINENDFLQVSPQINEKNTINKNSVSDKEVLVKPLIKQGPKLPTISNKNDKEYLPSNFADLLLHSKCSNYQDKKGYYELLRDQHR